MPSLGRLHLVTDTRPGRHPLTVVRAALGVARAELVVQVRVLDDATDREAYDLARRVVGLCAPVGATCLVNDRLHVALAVGAAGGHVGALDLPVSAARRVIGPAALLGATAREPGTARRAVADGASYLGVGPCHATYTKEGLPPPIGPAGVRAVVEAVSSPGIPTGGSTAAAAARAAVPVPVSPLSVPVIAIGGVTAATVPALRAAGAYGVAVVAALSAAADPARATADLLIALGAQSGPDGALAC